MSAEGLENMKGVKLPKVSQIGIVVPDIGKAVRYYSKFLNIKPWFRSKTTSNDAAFKGEFFPSSWTSLSPSAAAWKSSSYRC